MKPDNGPALRVATLSPAEIAEWDAFEAQGRPGIDRVTCLRCLNRSGARCEPLSMPHVPFELYHRCAHYRVRRAA